MLLNRCPILSVLSCLSVTLAYCGQTVGWINMALATEVGLGTGDILLDGDRSPTGRYKTDPLFGPSVVAER